MRNGAPLDAEIEVRREVRRTRRSALPPPTRTPGCPATPSATSGTDSITSCRTIRDRRAPSAMRTPSSRTRPVARDITRLPRFAAATIRTRPVRLPIKRDHGQDGVSLARPHEVVAGQQRLQPLVALDLRAFGGHRLHRRAQRLARRGRRHAGAQPAVHVDAVAVAPRPAGACSPDRNTRAARSERTRRARCSRDRGTRPARRRRSSPACDRCRRWCRRGWGPRRAGCARRCS